MELMRIKHWTLLLAITVFSFAIKAYDAIRSPVLAALDPWGWVAMTREFLATHELNTFFTQTGYPPTFMYFVAALTSFGADAYDVVRYIPVISALNVIPVYLLTLDIFRSKRISTLATLLTITSRFYFMRTSIGVPESSAHFFVVFTLFFLWRALTTRRWTNVTFAAGFSAVSLLYYHFTLIIILPFLIALPFAMKPRKETLRAVVATIIPALLISGIIWYFRALPNMIHYYTGTKVYTYQIPVFERSITGILRLLVYSGAKTGVVALSELGYVAMALAVLAVLDLVFLQKTRAEHQKGIDFQLTYLIVLAALAFGLRAVYNLGVAGAGDSSVYVFSWAAMPIGIFASYSTTSGFDALVSKLNLSSRKISLKHVSTIVAVALIISLTLANLSAINYYKASSEGGLGIMQAHYYYKPMTDQEYYALQYLREHSPSNSLVLVVGVEHQILSFQAIVAERTIVSIKNASVVGETITMSGSIESSSLQYTNLTQAELRMNNQTHEPIYLVIGIRMVSLDVARANGFPPASTTLLEQLLLRGISAHTVVYSNEQVTVLQIQSATFSY